MNPYIVRKQVAIKGTPEQVWDALTNPEKTKQYFFNCEAISDWQVGSTITFKGKMFFFLRVEMKGRIVKIEPPRLLQYTLKNEDSSSTSTVRDELSYENGETVLSITDDVGEGEGAEKRYARSDKGWDKVLKGLKELVEKENQVASAA